METTFIYKAAILQNTIWRDIIKHINLKATPKRLEVMNCLGAESSYLSADEVWQRLKPKFTSLGLPTIYRILDELSEAGVVTRIFMSDNKQFYFLCPNQSHHHHFVCESCRSVTDIDHCGIDLISSEFEKTSGARVKSHIIQVNGICAACNQQGGPADV
jgi:Fe2+ or Zn2+ uptake regulation protein